jgi:hypothetical protein
MKAFVVTILVPADWTKTDVVSSCNIGLQQWAEKQRQKPLTAMDYNVVAHTEFKLDREAL